MHNTSTAFPALLLLLLLFFVALHDYVAVAVADVIIDAAAVAADVAVAVAVVYRHFVWCRICVQRGALSFVSRV